MSVREIVRSVDVSAYWRLVKRRVKTRFAQHEVVVAMNRLGLRLVLLFLVSLALSSGCFSTARADEIAAFAAKGAASWTPFDTSERATLRLDTTVELVLDPEPSLRALHP